MKMYNPPHAGELIAETLEELGLGVRDLAKALDVAPSTAHKLISGKSSVTPEMAIKLSAVLGSSAKFWLNIQDNYSLSKAEQYVDISRLKLITSMV